MLTREQALEILHTNLQASNLRRHCYAVEVVMQALARRLGGDPEIWGIAGLLHDADYELTKNEPAKHTHVLLEWLKDIELHTDVRDAILAHGWGYVEGNPEPKTPIEWSLYCCDELTGFIVAVTLVKPDKQLASVTIDSVLSKWRQKSFAGGVHREQIEKCEEKLGIPLRDFIEIALTSMQSIAPKLGL